MKKTLINYVQTKKFDDLYTPAYAIYPLLEFVPKGITIWECTDFGGSEITRILREHGCEVISTDKEENFLNYNLESFDMIITNPPFSLKDSFLKRCYELGKPFALLLPITALEGKKRNKLFSNNSIEVLVLDSRIDFTGSGKCWFNVSWFCSGVLPKQLVFKKVIK